MLVQFTLENFLSFKEETVFDMRAINSYKEHPDHIIDRNRKERLLRVASVYGANASGKTNLYYAMLTFVRIIDQSMNSFENKESAISHYHAPFAFDKQDDDTMFEAIIERNGYQYIYGFQYNDKAVTSEWAYRRSLKSNRQSVLLERDRDEIVFGATARRDCNKYRNQIPNETLVLTFLNKLKQDNPFHELQHAIDSIIVTPTDVMDKRDFLDALLPHIIDSNKERFVDYLSALDTGIKDIRYVREGKDTFFFTTHYGEDGEKYELNLFSESAGTIRCIALYINISMVMMTGSTLVIDELNLRLHPLLLKYIINFFYNTTSEAQLIYTTHDVTLLKREYFRRDQIWLVEKDKYGHSSLSAISDYKRRSDASFDKEYLGGVYGGIPEFGTYSFDRSPA